MGATGKPKIAFLFLTRGPMPLEPVWRRWFATADASEYTVHTHTVQVHAQLHACAPHALG